MFDFDEVGGGMAGRILLLLLFRACRLCAIISCRGAHPSMQSCARHESHACRRPQTLINVNSDPYVVQVLCPELLRSPARMESRWPTPRSVHEGVRAHVAVDGPDGPHDGPPPVRRNAACNPSLRAARPARPSGTFARGSRRSSWSRPSSVCRAASVTARSRGRCAAGGAGRRGSAGYRVRREHVLH